MKSIAKEVKEEVLSKIKLGEPAATITEQYGISVKTIYGWLRWTTINKVSWMEHIRLKKENEQLKEIIGVLTLELEKTKKKK